LVKRHAAKHSRTEDRRELCSGRYDLGKAFLDVEHERPATILGFDSISIRCHLTRLLGINLECYAKVEKCYGRKALTKAALGISRGPSGRNKDGSCEAVLFVKL